MFSFHGKGIVFPLQVFSTTTNIVCRSHQPCPNSFPKTQSRLEWWQFFDTGVISRGKKLQPMCLSPQTTKATLHSGHNHDHDRCHGYDCHGHHMNHDMTYQIEDDTSSEIFLQAMQKQQCKPGPWPGAGSIGKHIEFSSLQFVCSELFRRGPVVAASGALWRLQVLPNEDGQGKWWWLVVRFVVTTEMGTGEIGVRLRLPEWQCDQCILQWTYTAGQIRNIYNHKFT